MRPATEVVMLVKTTIVLRLTEDVFWFSMDVKQTPWAQALLAHTSAKRSIGTLEMLGSLVLFMLAAELVCPRMLEIHLPFTTDNEGNAYSASKRSSKKWPCSALLIELSAQEFQKGVFAHVTHVKRCSNTWADQLTHFNFDRCYRVLCRSTPKMQPSQTNKTPPPLRRSGT